MTDAVLFAGGEFDSLTVVSGSPSESAAAVFDSSYARRAILCTDSGAVIRHNLLEADDSVATVVTGETIWFHFNCYYGGTANTTRIWKAIDSSGNPWFALRGGGSSDTLRAQYNSNTGGSPTWVDLGAAFAAASSAVKRYDVKITLGSPHSFEVWVDEVLKDSGTFTNANLTSLAGAEFNGFSDGTDCYWSQMMATRGISTVYGKVRTRAFGATGNQNGWTSGAYTDVNEGTLNDATAMVSAAANQVYTFNIDDISTPGGLTPRWVFTWARGKNDGTSPTNFQHAIRSGGTDYFSNNVANIGSTYGPLGASWPTNPSGSNWSDSNWNSAEVGGKSIA